MDYKVKPWAHQLDAIEQARGKTHFALFFEQGTGKSFTVLQILREVYAKGSHILPTLILCPAIVVENWKREILKYTDIDEEWILTLTGSQRERCRDISQFIANGIIITNYEALLMADLYADLMKWSPNALVLDESQRIKDSMAKRTKAAIRLGERATYRYILSGTPITNSIFDIWSQFHFLDRGETFGTFFQFRARFFEDKNWRRPKAAYFPDWQPKWGAEREINKLIYGKAIRIKKSECLDLPPFVRQVVNFDLSSEEKKIYREIEKECVSYFRDTVVSADLAIKKAIRLHQITNGFVTDDVGTTQCFSNPRVDAMEDIIESIPKDAKIIIWAVFKQNYRDIKARLQYMNIPLVELTGDTPPEQRQQNIDRFNRKNSCYRVLLGHPRAGGVGCNLTAGSYAIFYSHGFSLEDDEQAEARNYRGGSEIHEKITRIDIVANGTIDETVVMALKDKKNLSETILKYMKGIK